MTSNTTSYCVDITDNNFKSEVLDTKNLVLVDFWAQWCGPCKMVERTLEKISKHYEKKLKIVKINIDNNSLIPPKYNVKSIPTLILFKNGKNIKTNVGVIQTSQLISIIDYHL